MTYTVGISEMRISQSPDDVLVTYSLGSCVGLTLYDPVLRAGGLIHCMLPLSKIDLARGEAVPQMFTDTGVQALIEGVLNLGAEREQLVAKVAGAASLLGGKDAFNIGERNYTVLRKMLWKNNILIAGEDVGGTYGRSMCLYVGTGKTVVRIAGQDKEL